MKRSTKNQIKGRGHELKGAIKEGAGRAMHNRGMESRGTVEKIAGKVQKRVGDVERDYERDLDED